MTSKPPLYYVWNEHEESAEAKAAFLARVKAEKRQKEEEDRQREIRLLATRTPENERKFQEELVEIRKLRAKQHLAFAPLQWNAEYREEKKKRVQQWIETIRRENANHERKCWREANSRKEAAWLVEEVYFREQDGMKKKERDESIEKRFVVDYARIAEIQGNRISAMKEWQKIRTEQELQRRRRVQQRCLPIVERAEEEEICGSDIQKEQQVDWQQIYAREKKENSQRKLTKRDLELLEGRDIPRDLGEFAFLQKRMDPARWNRLSYDQQFNDFVAWRIEIGEYTPTPKQRKVAAYLKENRSAKVNVRRVN